jgi:hypothetical protein
MHRPLHPVSFLILFLAYGTAVAQDAVPVDPALPDHLKDLKAMVADPKMQEDFRAIGLIQKLVSAPEKLNPKDAEKLAKALGEVFKTGKPRPVNKAQLYKEAGEALGKLKENGAKELAKVLTESRIKDRDYVPVQAPLYVQLGRTQDEKQIDLLVDAALNSPHDDIRGAAGEALGCYEAMDLKKRREVVKDMIRSYGALHSKATQPEPADPNGPIDFSPQNARETLAKIEGRWTATLGKLTGQGFSAFPDWQRWLNKNPSWQPPGTGRPPGPKKQP